MYVILLCVFSVITLKLELEKIEMFENDGIFLPKCRLRATRRSLAWG